jgi:hypothetical protein
MQIRGDAGFVRDFQFQSGVENRWILRTGATAEAGANAGSDFQMLAFDDAGVSLGTAFTITRSSRIMAFQVSPTGPTPAAGDSSLNLATTAFVAGGFSKLGMRRAINLQTGTTYTLALADAGQVIDLDNAASITVTVPANATIAFPIGSWIDLVQHGAGQVTISPAATVTIISAGAALKTRVQYSGITLIKRATNEWYLIGDRG